MHQHAIPIAQPLLLAPLQPERPDQLVTLVDRPDPFLAQDAPRRALRRVKIAREAAAYDELDVLLAMIAHRELGREERLAIARAGNEDRVALGVLGLVFLLEAARADAQGLGDAEHGLLA